MDNGVGSQSTFINPYTAKMFSLSSNAVVTDPRHLPVSHIKYPLSRIWAVESGWEETKKSGGWGTTSPSNNQGQRQRR